MNRIRRPRHSMASRLMLFFSLLLIAFTLIVGILFLIVGIYAILNLNSTADVVMIIIGCVLLNLCGTVR